MLTLIKMELYKILHSRLVIISIVLLLGLSGVIFFTHYNEIQPVQTTSGAIKQGLAAVKAENKEIAAFEGKFNDHTVRTIAKDYLKKSNVAPVELENKSELEQAVSNNFSQGSLKALTKNPQKISKKQAAALMASDNFIPLSKVFTQHSTSQMNFGPFLTWDNLVSTLSTLVLAILLVILVVAAQLFSNEYALKADQVILTTRFGRTRWSISKLIACTAFGLGLLSAFIALNVLAYGVIYGFEGWNSSVQLNLDLELFNFPWKLTNLQVLLLSVGLYMLAALFVIGLTSFISALSTAPVATLALGLILFILPVYMRDFMGYPLNGHFMELFPINFVDNELYWLFNLVTSTDHSSVAAEHLLMGIVGLSLAVFVLGGCLTFSYVKKRNVASS